MKNHGAVEELNKHLIDVMYRITGYDKDVLLEYVRLNDNKYSIYANLSIRSVYSETEEFKELMNNLYYLNRKMKIDKLIQKKSD